VLTAVLLVMMMSIGTARMYRGLVKYPIRAADGVPLKEAGAGDSSWFAGTGTSPANPSNHAEGYYDAGNVAPNSEVLPRSPTRNWWNGDMA
jgi:hypothetical protein